ncbi:MAG: terminase, partial [Proteobacteria bacterium]|nr:terminase [Pseudomonadota bacterium]
EELTNWADDECYRSMFACCRSSSSDAPRKVRATTNPYGVGHNWVKDRFRLSGQWWKTSFVMEPVDLKGRPEPPRCAIHSHIDENRILLEADPDYKTTVAASARNEAQARAWMNGSWDVVAGGMFDDVWSQQRNVVPPFDVPDSWRVDRAFDWGSSRPFSVGWYAESDGSDLKMPDGTWRATVRGDLFRIREWYGWTGRPNEGTRALAVEVAQGIVEREVLWGWRRGRECRVSKGVADSSIFTVENGISVANDMGKPVRIDGRIYDGVTWKPADKRPGSRKMGWEMMRRRIRAAQPKLGVPREQPGFFVVGEHCPHFLRTVLSLPRDKKDLDDVDTDAEDHVADEVRYRVRAMGTQGGSGTTTGWY